ncbi:MAG: CHAD domain-containing protein [Leptolyngbya sp. SIO4C1]|nr:CHAD domain-containing protein [Leptolyngbya sp. SIO4C1]
MSFYLQNRESIAAGVRRIAQEQVDKALFQLTQGVHQDPSEAIHDVRKRFKKIRALLRLVRDQLGKVYQRENTCFRDMGRRLAAVRDAQVRVETLNDLADHFEAAIAADAFDQVQQALTRYHLSTRRYLLAEENVTDAVLSELQQAQARIADWPLEQADRSVIKQGLKRVYKRGYKGLSAALADPSVENLHNWRKRAKYLRYHLRILKSLWPDYLKDYEDYLHQLTDYLGDDHDLAVLNQFIASQPQRIQASENLAALQGLMTERQRQLKAEAIRLGQRLYAEPPQAFVARFGTYWQLWRREYPRLPLSVESAE